MIKFFTTTFLLLSLTLSAQEYYQLKDFSPGSSSSEAFQMFGDVYGQLVFKLYNDVENDEEFWATNGMQDNGTLLTSYGTSFPSNLKQSTQGNNEVYFVANDQIHHYNGTYNMVANDVQAYRINIYNDELYIYDESNSNDCLSKLTSNPEELECVAEIGDARMKGLTTYNGDIILIGTEGNIPFLFRSNGTTAGTESFFDLEKKANANRFEHFMENDGLLYFYHERDFSGNIMPGLYVTDGTAAGTQNIGETHPGNIFNGPENLSVFHNNVLYTAGTSPVNEFAVELWTSDGTTGGTQFVKNLNGETSSSDPKNFVAFGNLVYFTAEAPDGNRKIWQTDGTEAGTVVFLDDLFSGDYGSFLTVYDGQLAFGAYNSDEGSELWFSDGTETGTAPITNESGPGENNYRPQNLYANGNLLYFSAFTADNGRELWVYSNGMVNTHEIDNSFYNINTAPNPFSENITFSMKNLDNSKTYQLQIMDTSGKMMEQIAVPTSGQVEWQGEDFPNGILFYHLMEKETGNVVATGRIVKM